VATLPVATQPTTPRRRGGFVGDFFVGVSFVFRGLGMYGRSPGLMLLGLLPAVIAFAVLAVGLVALVMWDANLVDALTPYANSWSTDLRDLFRTVVGLMLIAAWLLLSVLVYTALTLIIGEPFYEAISKRVDDNLGGVPGGDIDVSFWRSMPRSIVETGRTLTITVLGGLVIFLIGLIPVAGEVAGAIMFGALGGWALALELTAVPFERRGKYLRHRRHLLRQRRSMALGFGVTAFVLFLVPGLDILLMPAAVAGATLLTRRVSGEPDRHS
jgi:CysZ protein